ncbi:MAG: hypothetical protein E4G90_01515, partial [Gemmatimonadales bacterium]
MTRVVISGIPGRLASAVAAGVAAAEDLQLSGFYNPNRGGESHGDIPISVRHDEVACDVIFEATEPTVVMDNLRAWRDAGSTSSSERRASPRSDLLRCAPSGATTDRAASSP